MAGITQIGGVSAHISQVQLQGQYQTQAYARQQEVVKDVGTAALNLIQTVVSFDPHVGQNLDVLA